MSLISFSLVSCYGQAVSREILQYLTVACLTITIAKQIMLRIGSVQAEGLNRQRDQ